LEILSHTSYIDGGWYHVVGEVRNNTTVPMRYAKIVATLYDNAGMVVDTDFTYTELDVIPPGDKSPFQTGTDQWQGAANNNPQAQGREGLLPRQDLLIQGDQSYTEGSRLHIRGKVVNTGATPVEFVKNVATLYDTGGNVVGADFTYASLDMIPAGGNSPLETGTDHWPGFGQSEPHVQGH
jgi:hypothetical protein